MLNRDLSKVLLCILDKWENFEEIIAKHLIFFFCYCKEKRGIAYQKANLVYFRIVNSNLLFFRGRPSKVYQKQLLFIILLFGNHLWLAFVKTLKIQVWFTTKNLASMRHIISTCWKKNNNLVTTQTFSKFSTSWVVWKNSLFKVNSWITSPANSGSFTSKIHNQKDRVGNTARQIFGRISLALLN